VIRFNPPLARAAVENGAWVGALRSTTGAEKTATADREDLPARIFLGLLVHRTSSGPRKFGFFLRFSDFPVE
jgi:hypothetical protein